MIANTTISKIGVKTVSIRTFEMIDQDSLMY